MNIVEALRESYEQGAMVRPRTWEGHGEAVRVRYQNGYRRMYQLTRNPSWRGEEPWQPSYEVIVEPWDVVDMATLEEERRVLKERFG